MIKTFGRVFLLIFPLGTIFLLKFIKIPLKMNDLIFQNKIHSIQTIIVSLAFISREIGMSDIYARKYIKEIIGSKITKDNILAVMLFGTVKIARYRLNDSSLKKIDKLLYVLKPFRDIKPRADMV